MFVALTGSEASREVKVVSEFDESRFKVKELQQVLTAHMLAPGTRSKRETLDRMVGLQLFSPFIQTESTEERRLPCPSVEEFQNDLRSLGWLEGDFEEVEDLRETANLHCSDSAMEDPQPVPEEGQAKTKQSANENVGAVLVDRSGTAAEPVSLNRGVADRRSTPRFAQASEPSAQNEPGRDPRAPLSQQQLDVLESALAFVGPQYRPSRDAYSTLAKRTGLSSERVEAWFEEKRRTAMEEDGESGDQTKDGQAASFSNGRNADPQSNDDAAPQADLLSAVISHERRLTDTSLTIDARICSTVDAASAHVSHQAAGTGDPGKRSGEIGTPQQEAIDLNLTPVHEAFLAGAFALMPATDGALPESTCRSLAGRIGASEAAVASFYRRFKSTSKETHSTNLSFISKTSQDRSTSSATGTVPQTKNPSFATPERNPDQSASDEAARRELLAEEARAVESGSLPASLRTVLEDIKRFETAGTQPAGEKDVLRGKGRLGRKVAGVLVEDYESPNKDGTRDVLRAGVHVGTIIRAGGTAHDADLCERNCADTHDFYTIRFVCSESPRQRTKQRACLDLKIDLHQRLRLLTWTNLREMTLRNARALPDAWLLLARKTPLPPQPAAPADVPAAATAAVPSVVEPEPLPPPDATRGRPSGSGAPPEAEAESEAEAGAEAPEPLLLPDATRCLPSGSGARPRTEAEAEAEAEGPAPLLLPDTTRDQRSDHCPRADIEGAARVVASANDSAADARARVEPSEFAQPTRAGERGDSPKGARPGSDNNAPAADGGAAPGPRVPEVTEPTRAAAAPTDARAPVPGGGRSLSSASAAALVARRKFGSGDASDAEKATEKEKGWSGREKRSGLLKRRVSECVKNPPARRSADPFAFTDQMLRGDEGRKSAQEMSVPIATAGVPARTQMSAVSALLLAQAKQREAESHPARLTSESCHDASAVDAADALVADIVTQLGVDSTEPDSQRVFVPGSPPPVAPAAPIAWGWRSVVRSPGGKEPASKVPGGNSERVEGCEKFCEMQGASLEPVITSAKSPTQVDTAPQNGPQKTSPPREKQPASGDDQSMTFLNPPEKSAQDQKGTDENLGLKRKRKAALEGEPDPQNGWGERRARSSSAAEPSGGSICADDRVVWVRSGGSWWPGQVVTEESLSDKERQKLSATSADPLVRLFGKQPLISSMPASRTLPFRQHLKRFTSGRHSTDFNEAVQFASEALTRVEE